MNATNTTCRSIFKMQLLAGALVATLRGHLAVRGGSVARGQGGQTFGISPADAAAGAYFTYTLDPGASKSDRALVSNYTGTERPSSLRR